MVCPRFQVARVPASRYPARTILPDVPPLRPHPAPALLLLLAAGASLAQSPGPSVTPPAAPRPTLNHTLVFLDPAHGGDDPGARLPPPGRAGASTDQPLERDVTLALAGRLRSQLSALGLTVLMTREPQPPIAGEGQIAPAAPTLTPDQRAGLANHVRPFACIVLHATGSGSGVHLITSAVTAAPDTESSLIPWESAQASFLPQSSRLAGELATALERAGLAVHASRASIRPLDSLTCPAVLIELAPLPSAPVTDSGYQARVAQTVATALLFWRDHAEPDAVPESRQP